jgi:uncharacterized small protein (DUF1192 family)
MTACIYELVNKRRDVNYETRDRGCKPPGLVSVTELKHRQPALRREIAWLETQSILTEL